MLLSPSIRRLIATSFISNEATDLRVCPPHLTDMKSHLAFLDISWYLYLTYIEISSFADCDTDIAQLTGGLFYGPKRVAEQVEKIRGVGITHVFAGSYGDLDRRCSEVNRTVITTAGRL